MIKRSILVLLLTFSFFNITKAREIESNVIILMDFSNSYFGEEKKKSYQKKYKQNNEGYSIEKRWTRKANLLESR